MACIWASLFRSRTIYLDLLGDEETVGKSLGTDIMKQKSTLPLIRLLEEASPTPATA